MPSKPALSSISFIISFVGVKVASSIMINALMKDTKTCVLPYPITFHFILLSIYVKKIPFYKFSTQLFYFQMKRLSDFSHHLP